MQPLRTSIWLKFTYFLLIQPKTLANMNTHKQKLCFSKFCSSLVLIISLISLQMFIKTNKPFWKFSHTNPSHTTRLKIYLMFSRNVTISMYVVSLSCRLLTPCEKPPTNVRTVHFKRGIHSVKIKMHDTSYTWDIHVASKQYFAPKRNQKVAQCCDAVWKSGGKKNGEKA